VGSLWRPHLVHLVRPSRRRPEGKAGPPKPRRPNAILPWRQPLDHRAGWFRHPLPVLDEARHVDRDRLADQPLDLRAGRCDGGAPGKIGPRGAVEGGPALNPDPLSTFHFVASTVDPTMTASTSSGR